MYIYIYIYIYTYIQIYTPIYLYSVRPQCIVTGPLYTRMFSNYGNHDLRLANNTYLSETRAYITGAHSVPGLRSSSCPWTSPRSSLPSWSLWLRTSGVSTNAAAKVISFDGSGGKRNALALLGRQQGRLTGVPIKIPLSKDTTHAVTPLVLTPFVPFYHYYCYHCYD